MLTFLDRTKNRVWGGRVLLAALSILAARGSTVLGGSADTTGVGAFSVFGSGFSMVGAGGTCDYYCSFVVSKGSGVYSFTDSISSEYASGVTGSYTLEGQQYSYYCTAGTPCCAGVEFSGTFTWPGGLPPFSFVTVTTPFTAQGGIVAVLIAPRVLAPPLYFSGGGIATITLKQSYPGVPIEFAGGNYTFVATPEPSAMSLMGFGLVAMAIGCLRSRRSG